jgi:two-component system LytT family response regulator
MGIKTLIVDDEKPARLRLRTQLQKMPEIEVVGEAENGEAAVRLIKSLRPDLVLLDVQMPVLNGFQVLEKISRTPEIIFVTAWDRYAIRAFEVNAVDYLLKPYSRDRLVRAIEKAARAIRESVDRRAQILAVLEKYRESETRISRITVRKGNEFHVLETEEVDLFRAEEGLVFVYSGGSRYYCDEPLQRLEEGLDSGRFYRVHRGAIVNLNSIEKVLPLGNGKYEIEIAAKERVAVSRDRSGRLKSLTGMGGRRRHRSTGRET